MKLKHLTEKDLELVEDAKALIKKRFTKKTYVEATVAASLRTKSGKTYNGININLLEIPPCSICAEYSAIAKMFSGGEKEIESIVAVGLKNKKYSVLPPCGQCRQFISYFGDPFIILQVKGRLKKARLSDLMLYWYK